MAVRGQLVFRGVKLGLHARELFFQELEGLLRLGATHLDILLEVGIGDRIEDFRHAVGILVGHLHADDAGILALLGDVQTLEEARDRNLRMDSRKLEHLALSRLYGTHAHDERIVRIGLAVRLAHDTLQNHLLVVVQNLERGRIGEDTGVNLHARQAYGLRNLQVFEVHSPFAMQQAVHLVERGGREADAFFFHHGSEHHAALEQLHFGFGRRRRIQEGAHFAKRLDRLVALDIDLEQDVATIGRTHPHGRDSAGDDAQNQKDHQESPLALEKNQYFKNIDFIVIGLRSDGTLCNLIFHQRYLQVLVMRQHTQFQGQRILPKKARKNKR